MQIKLSTPNSFTKNKLQVVGGQNFTYSMHDTQSLNTQILKNLKYMQPKVFWHYLIAFHSLVVIFIPAPGNTPTWIPKCNISAQYDSTFNMNKSSIWQATKWSKCYWTSKGKFVKNRFNQKNCHFHLVSWTNLWKIIELILHIFTRCIFCVCGSLCFFFCIWRRSVRLSLNISKSNKYEHSIHTQNSRQWKQHGRLIQ